MPRTPLHVLPTPDDIGQELAGRLLSRIDRARIAGRRFLLGSPTGRSPRPLFEAMGDALAKRPQHLGHVVFVMMDEYLVEKKGALVYAPPNAPWSCHWFARVEIAERLNAGLPESHRLTADAIWFPDPRDPSG